MAVTTTMVVTMASGTDEDDLWGTQTYSAPIFVAFIHTSLLFPLISPPLLSKGTKALFFIASFTQSVMFGFGYHHAPPVNPMLGAVENATGMDLNGDGRVGHRPMYQQYGPQYHYGGPQYGGPQYGGPAFYPPPPVHYYAAQPQVVHYYGPPPVHPVLGAVENATGMDLNGDGRIGHRPMYHHGGHYGYRY
jgi:hypothetical protein